LKDILSSVLEELFLKDIWFEKLVKIQFPIVDVFYSVPGLCQVLDENEVF
jgi:hypothetical protein